MTSAEVHIASGIVCKDVHMSSWMWMSRQMYGKQLQHWCHNIPKLISKDCMTLFCPGLARALSYSVLMLATWRRLEWYVHAGGHKSGSKGKEAPQATREDVIVCCPRALMSRLPAVLPWTSLQRSLGSRPRQP